MKAAHKMRPSLSYKRASTLKTECQSVLAGSLRPSSSKKLKKKVTLLIGAVLTPVDFNTATRLPSGCKSKVVFGPRVRNWPGDQSFGALGTKESPVTVYVTTMILPSGARYTSSLLRDHRGEAPPPAEICHLPPGPGNGWT